MDLALGKMTSKRPSHQDRIINFPSKIEIILKLKRRLVSPLVSLVIKTRENIQSIYQQTLSKDMLIYF